MTPRTRVILAASLVAAGAVFLGSAAVGIIKLPSGRSEYEGESAIRVCEVAARKMYPAITALTDAAYSGGSEPTIYVRAVAEPTGQGVQCEIADVEGAWTVQQIRLDAR